MRARFSLSFAALALTLSACGTSPVDLPAAPPPDVQAQIERIDTMAAALRLTEQEQVWQRIDWERDAGVAQARAQATGRPIFLFSMWGELDGRC